MGTAFDSRRLEMHAEYWSENLKGRDHYDGLSVCRRIILKWMVEVTWEDAESIHLSLDIKAGALCESGD
jgi:hypothetical protein